MIIFLESVCRDKVWGGTKIREKYRFRGATEKTGEVTLLSGLPGVETIIKNGEFKGKNINELFREHKYLFGELEGDTFPLVCKIINAQQDLSLQVHPNDKHAYKHHNCAGKEECWYVLEAKENSKIVVGHNAQTKEELKERILKREWEELVTKIDFKSKDFIYIPAGAIHSVPKDTMLLELAQASDITYRIHDYEREHPERPLHTKQALTVAKVPYEYKKLSYDDPFQLVDNDYFNARILNIDKPTIKEQTDNFTFGFVLNGEGTINDEAIKEGDVFLIPAINSFIYYNGNMQLLLASK
ncbi:MAG: hypothetical protein FWE36_07640 [Erysipelotrichales bacterium]|nr:hypothetical protein [Erysipelotrichales bacterium]